jgi:hypothetical protein
MQQQFNGKKANSRTYHQFSKLVNSAMHEPVSRRPLGLTAEDMNASPPRQPVSKPAPHSRLQASSGLSSHMLAFNILGPSPHNSPDKPVVAPSPFTHHPKLPHSKQYAEQKSSEEAKYDDRDL